MSTSLGKTIRQLRESRGMSQADLSEGIMSSQHLSNIERGNSDLTVSKYWQLIERLRITPTEFNTLYLSLDESH